MSNLPDASKLLIAELASDDGSAVTAVHELLTAALGIGAVSLSHIHECAAGERGAGSAVIAIWSGSERQKLMAAGTVELLQGDLSYYARFGATGVELLSKQRCGSIATLAVSAEVRGRGLGHATVEAQIAWLKNHGATLLVAVAWMHGGTHQSYSTFERLGFESVGEAQNVYLEDSLIKGLQCQACNGPCLCAGRLYLRQVM